MTGTSALHGHQLAGNMARAAAAEAVGTFVLVLSIVSTVIAAALAEPVAGSPYSSVAVPLAGGIALTALVASLGHVSGAHLNPAVTLGLAISRRFPPAFVASYVLAQFAGLIAASAAAWALYGPRAKAIAHLGAVYPAAGTGVGRVLGAEGVVTFVLVLVVISVATDSRVPRGAAAMAIGSALAVAIFISGPVSGAGVNPARALGPAILAGQFTDWWAYLAAPVIGASLAIVLYDRVLRNGSPPMTLNLTIPGISQLARIHRTPWMDAVKSHAKDPEFRASAQ
jgi:MIP family channel proteins